MRHWQPCSLASVLTPQCCCSCSNVKCNQQVWRPALKLFTPWWGGRNDSCFGKWWQCWRVRGSEQLTPLVVAAQNGHTDICGILLATGRNVNEMYPRVHKVHSTPWRRRCIIACDAASIYDGLFCKKAYFYIFYRRYQKCPYDMFILL